VVLRLTARTGDDILTLRGPGDEVVTQEHRIDQSELASVGTTNLVSISVDGEVRRRGTVKKPAEIEGALNVANDALCGREMGLTRVVHVSAHLLDRVGNVRPSEGEEDQVRGEAVVPRSRCLLQAIEGHVELTH
jgi:hypothetical protein